VGTGHVSDHLKVAQYPEGLQADMKSLGALLNSIREQWGPDTSGTI
jgi:hypothetical protein